MSIWTRIVEAVSALTSGQSLAEVFDALLGPRERSVAFTIAVIALSAKMAKADGQVTRDEVMAFREVFVIAPEDEPAAARVFNLARQDVAGFESYARRIGRMFSDEPGLLEDVLDGLMHIAVADGVYHPRENAFLERVAVAFGLDERTFRSIRARHPTGEEPDPYSILGLDPATPLPEARARYRALVRENHPDRLMARGLPEEAVNLASQRLAAINRAWAELETLRSTA